MFSAYTMLFVQNVILGDKENKSNQKGSLWEDVALYQSLGKERATWILDPFPALDYDQLDFATLF